MPAASRSSTSSRMARAICFVDSSREMSSRGNDQLRMVTGPVSMPFIGFLVRLWAKVDHFTVMACGRLTSPQTMGGLTQRVP